MMMMKIGVAHKKLNSPASLSLSAKAAAGWSGNAGWSACVGYPLCGGTRSTPLDVYNGYE